MNPLFHTDCSISDSLKSVRKSVLIYETIIAEDHLEELTEQIVRNPGMYAITEMKKAQVRVLIEQE